MDIKKVVGIMVAFLVLLFVVGRFVSNPSRTTATTPADQSLVADKWQVSESRSPMDDSKTVVLSLESDDVIQGPAGARKPKLMIRCKEGKTDTYVVTGMAASVEEDYDGGPREDHTVNIRLDEGSPLTEHWDESSPHDALFIGADGMAFAKILAQTKKLTFQFTPFDANPAVARFDLRGLDKHLGRVADACGWNLN